MQKSQIKKTIVHFLVSFGYRNMLQKELNLSVARKVRTWPPLSTPDPLKSRKMKCPKIPVVGTLNLCLKMPDNMKKTRN